MNRKPGLIAVSLLLLVAARARAETPPAPPATPSPPTADQRTRYQQEVEDRLHGDWAYLARFREENARLAPPARGKDRVVFMGDSITEGWGRLERIFPGKPYVNRGISGQTTPQ